MSLKGFHILFVLVAICLCFGLGGWSLKNFFEGKDNLDLVFGVGAFLLGIGLVIYGKAVLKKLKNLSSL